MTWKTCIDWLAVVAVVWGTRQLKAEPFHPSLGVVVEKVGKPSAPEKAGLQPGDLLLSWERFANEHSEGERGTFDTIFTWFVFLTEQTPCGTLALHGERGGEARVFEIPLGDWWGMEVRPVMAPAALVHYRQGQELIDAGKVAEGVAEWEALFRQTALPPDLACWLRIQIGETWAEQRDWEKADTALKSALTLADEPWSQIAVWDAIAETRKKQNQLDEAIKAYQTQAEIWKNHRGEGLGFAKSVSSKGDLARLRGKMANAMNCFKKALDIRKRIVPNTLPVSNSLENLGNLAITRGDLDAADTYYQHALNLRESLAPGSLSVAASLGNLGSLAAIRGDLNTATTYCTKVLSIIEILDPESLNLANALNNLGVIAKKRGDLITAEKFLRRALDIRERIVPGSLDVAINLNNLGTVVGNRGKLKASLSFHIRALAIRESSAPGSLDVAASFSNLGVLAKKRGDLNAAASYHKRALDILERLAPGSLQIAACLQNLGVIAWNHGDLNAAFDFYERAFAIKENLAPGSLEVAGILNNLGLVAWKREDLNAAVIYFKKTPYPWQPAHRRLRRPPLPHPARAGAGARANRISGNRVFARNPPSRSRSQRFFAR